MKIVPRILLLLLLAAGGLYGQAVKPAPTPTPTPAISPTPVPTPTPVVETLADLQAKIRSRIQRPELRRGQVGIKIVSLNSGKVVFEENAEKYFMPASNMKNFTVAAALEKLTPDFRFVTSVYAASQPDSSGTIKGDLRIFGRGDVSISTAFYNGDHYKGLDALVDKIIAASVKRIEGNLIADESFFIGSGIPGEWEVDDLQWYYGAEVSALPINDNAVDLSVLPGMNGTGCAVSITPSNTVVRVVNLCTTGPAGSRRTLKIEKKLGQNVLEITGSLPADNRGFKGYVTVSRPADLFVALLKERLAQKGIVVIGQTLSTNDGYRAPLSGNTPPPGFVEITSLPSPPLSFIAAKTMKPSQNMYTETLLWRLGEAYRLETRASAMNAAYNPVDDAPSATLGIMAISDFLKSIGIPSDGIIQHDGSGLSRHNLITPSAVVRLYQYMGKESKYSAAWRNSLTIAGVDGTLEKRMAGTRASGNMRGKTGTIDQVSALSGYVTTAAGEQLVVSFIVNGVNVGRDRTSMMDDIVVSLANFAGKID